MGRDGYLFDRILTPRNLFHAAAALVFAYAFFLSLTPLTDSDLWWHLKTGERIVTDGTLPGDEDPFSFTSPKPLSEGHVKGLRSQWLGQTALYLVYRAGGFPGLALMRASLIALPFLVMYIIFSMRGAHPLLLASLLFPPLFIIALNLQNTFERPQAFSFIFFLLTVVFLEKLRGGATRPYAVLLPALMLVWANTHGGYIVGVAAIGLYMIAGASALVLKRVSPSVAVGAPVNPKWFFMSSALSILASLLSPGDRSLLLGWLKGTAKTIATLSADAGGSIVLRDVLEYKSLWYFYNTLHHAWPLYVLGFMALAFLALAIKSVYQGGIDLAEVLLFAFLSFLGLYYSRGADFALIGLSFLAAGAVSYIGGLKRIFLAIAGAALLLVVLVQTWAETPWRLHPGLPQVWVEMEDYPEGAIRFIEEEGLGGRVFNYYGWGGYLIWRAHPRLKVFIDGRAISNEALVSYSSIIEARPSWQEALDRHGVDLILIPLIAGRVIDPLAVRIADERPAGWRLIYLKGNAAVLVRDSEANRALIARYGLPFERIYEDALSFADLMLISSPGNENLLLSKALALIGLGRREEARRILLTLPESPDSKRLLERAGR